MVVAHPSFTPRQGPWLRLRLKHIHEGEGVPRAVQIAFFRSAYSSCASRGLGLDWQWGGPRTVLFVVQSLFLGLRLKNMATCSELYASAVSVAGPREKSLLLITL